MKTSFTFLSLLLILAQWSFSQTWQMLPNAPAAEFVNDDIFFINEQKGWMVNLDGFIYRTEDGGDSWDTLLIQPGTAFRCIGFTDSLHGFAGNLGPGSWISNVTDTIPLYETHDGGLSWSPVTAINGFIPAGICGINVVDDSVIYAVGRYAGPCAIMKSTNGGESWTSTLATNLFSDLIDVYFFSPDTGIVVGGKGLYSRINYTTDGGVTWQTVFTNNEPFTWHWKISFPSRYIGYSSIEGGNGTNSRLAKTTDGGLSWQLMPLNYPTDLDATGIGFMNDTLGWIGCWYPGVDYMTTDGGETWTLYPLDPSFNRFRKVSETAAYICGERVWKYTGLPVGAVDEADTKPGYTLYQNFPNPFTDQTTITYVLPEAGFVMLKVFDSGGRTVKTLVSEMQNAGTYTYLVNLPNLATANFYCKLSVNDFNHVIKMKMVHDEPGSSLSED